MSLTNRIFLAYSNTAHTDGGAAQLQRKVAIYCLARAHSMRYLNSQIIKIDYPGVNNLEIKKGLEHQWDSLYSFPTDKQPRRHKTIEIPLLELELWEWILSINNYPRLLRTFLQLYRLRNRSKEEFEKVNGHLKLSFCVGLLLKKNVVIKLSNIYPTLEPKIDQNYCHIKEITKNFHPPAKKIVDRTQVAVHIRRGDLLIRESGRILSDIYFNKLMRFISELAARNSQPLEILIFTDCPKSEIRMYASDHETWNWSHSKSQQIEIIPDMYSWDYMDGVHEASISILDDVESFKLLHFADILIASKSSYSYLPALFNPGKIIMPKFWHAGLIGWLNVEPLEIEEFNDLVQERVKNFLTS